MSFLDFLMGGGEGGERRGKGRMKNDTEMEGIWIKKLCKKGNGER